MSEIPKFWLLPFISQLPPYLLFILVSTHPVNMVLSSSENAQYLHLFTPLLNEAKFKHHLHLTESCIKVV